MCVTKAGGPKKEKSNRGLFTSTNLISHAKISDKCSLLLLRGGRMKVTRGIAGAEREMYFTRRCELCRSGHRSTSQAACDAHFCLCQRRGEALSDTVQFLVI